jgi:2-C-methyl-D-erythritol 4-phosphate cytidylyltransferase
VQTPQASWPRTAGGGRRARRPTAPASSSGRRPKVVEGDSHLLKVTTADDLAKIASWL